MSNSQGHGTSKCEASWYIPMSRNIESEFLAVDLRNWHFIKHSEQFLQTLRFKKIKVLRAKIFLI